MNVARLLEKAATSVHMLALRVSDRARQSEEQLARDNQRYWQDRSNKVFESFSHWRGKGSFENDELWLRLGRAHLELFEKAAAWSELRGPTERIVEWGCGGGMNAVQFAPRAREYYGVDISADSLDECAKQLAGVQADGFAPILIGALLAHWAHRKRRIAWYQILCRVGRRTERAFVFARLHD